MHTIQELHDAFMELGMRAQREGKVIDLAVYGGSALMLASNFRVTTQDVDAVVEGDQGMVTRWAADIAQRHDWPREWLNDGVRTYLSPRVDGPAEHHVLFRAYPSEQEPGLRVFVPSPEYMLAMKLMAMRLDPTGAKSDLADILNLLDVVGLRTLEEALSFVVSFYPEARVSGRLHLGLREVWRAKEHLTTEGQHDAPHYLGRGRQPS